jgi:hypothetical protein
MENLLRTGSARLNHCQVRANGSGATASHGLVVNGNNQGSVSYYLEVQ